MKRRNLSKRIAVIAIVAVMTLGMIACGKKDKEGTDTSVSSTGSVSQDSKKNETSVTNDEKNVTSDDSHDWPYMDESFGKRYVVETYKNCEDLSEWGNYKKFQLHDCAVYIKFPILIPTSDRRIAYQGDGTVVMFVPMGNLGEQINGLDTILQVAIDNQESPKSPIFMIKSHFGIHSEGYVNISIDSSNAETIGQYDCYKYTGSANYVVDKEFEPDEHTIQFVAYGTFAKSTNEAFYWLVFDETKDQTMGSALADYAKKMGYTIVEDAE